MRSKSSSDSISWQSPDRLEELKQIQSLTHTKFKDLRLLHQAFVHRSFANELDSKTSNDNERLEFLGDSVLGILAAEYLYLSLPTGKEGKLAKLKSKIVSTPAIAAIARKYEFNRFLLLGKGEKEKGESNHNLQADCFEAFLGALFLDQGMEECRRFLKTNFKKMDQLLDDVEETKDYKTILQEYCQKKWKTIPIYEVLGEEGPDHEKSFLISVAYGDKFKTKGQGKNKRTAEQQAAKLALLKLGLL